MANGEQHRHYEISIDRAGLALAVGGAAYGAIAAVLLALGGRNGLEALASAFVLGTIFSSLALTAVGGPVWLFLHAANRRGPVAAAAAGALIGFLLSMIGQVNSLPGAGTLSLYPLLCAIGSSLVVAAVTAAIALGMWRIAYRAVG